MDSSQQPRQNRGLVAIRGLQERACNGRLLAGLGVKGLGFKGFRV